MLTHTLQQLEKDDPVRRTSYPEVPPHVEYDLTHFGEGAAKHVAALADWQDSNPHKVPDTQQCQTVKALPTCVACSSKTNDKQDGHGRSRMRGPGPSAPSAS